MTLFLLSHAKRAAGENSLTCDSKFMPIVFHVKTASGERRVDAELINFTFSAPSYHFGQVSAWRRISHTAFAGALIWISLCTKNEDLSGLYLSGQRMRSALGRVRASLAEPFGVEVAQFESRQMANRASSDFKVMRDQWFRFW
jgi:hypothetical protein